MKKGILSALSFACGGIAGILSVGTMSSKKTNEAQKYADKYLATISEKSGRYCS